MFGIFKRLTRLEKEVLAVSLESGDTLGMVYDLEKKIKHLENQVDMLVVAVTRTRLGMNEKAAPKKKPSTKQLLTAKQGKAISGLDVYETDALPKKKAHLNADGFVVSYGEPVKKKRGRPRKIVS